MSEENDMNESVTARIDRVSAGIEARLDLSIVDNRIDLEILRDQDSELHQLLAIMAESKTVRDDPKMTARDVAKLLEARSAQTPLGNALSEFAKSQKL